MNRLGEIETRLGEIEKEVPAMTGEQLEAAEIEIKSLQEERGKIKNEVEKREALKAKALEGRGSVVVSLEKEKEQRYTAADKIYTRAWAKVMLEQRLTAEEQRALNEVNYRDSVVGPITSTATEFVTQTDTVVGQNNAGLFIPQYVSDRLLDETTLESPVLRDVFKMSVAGLTKYPYKKKGDPAKWREEGVCNDLEAIEWGELTFAVKELSKTIRTTWKLEAMTPDSFINYITGEGRAEMQKALAISLIYGTGATSGSAELNGLIGTNLTHVSVTGDNLIDTIIKAGEMLPKDKRIGAKAYISSAHAAQIALMKDSEGRYLVNPFGDGTPGAIGRYKVEVDPYLEDNDYFVGNLNRGAILNTVEGVTVTKDTMGRCRVNDYTFYGIYGSVIVPDHIVKGEFVNP